MFNTVFTQLLRLAVVACCVLATQTSSAEIVNFGSGSNAFTMEFVTIGNAGNVDDTAGNPNPAGAVGYTYSMGKFEVSRDMVTKANNASGMGITLADLSSYGGNGADRPATGVSWNEAARFVNWLNTNSGGFAAYNFTTSGVNDNITPWTAADTLDYDAANPFRSIRATYVLPSMDEWYKAAYYNPTTEMYGDYPSSDGIVPTAAASGTADQTAVFSQPLLQGPADIYEAGGLSAYGIMGLGGNVHELDESEFDLENNSGSSLRGGRGGYWVSSPGFLSASFRGSVSPTFENLTLGFRVSSLNSVPEPNSVIMFGVALLGLSQRRRRLS